jgi:hypothetical protein
MRPRHHRQQALQADLMVADVANCDLLVIR